MPWHQIKGLEYDHRHQSINLMLQSLLSDRFQLRISHQPKKLNAYALIQTKGGAKLRINPLSAIPCE